MKIAGSNALFLNGAVAAVAVASFLFAGHAMFVEETVPSCSTRYVEGTRLSLDRDGEALSAADLQGQANGLDWGLSDRARIVALKEGPDRFALELDLASRKGEPRFGSRDHKGAGVMWLPQSTRAGRSACLSYSIYLQDDLDMQHAVELPGLVGAAPGVELRSDAAPAFTARVAWQDRGAIDVLARTSTKNQNHSVGNSRGKFDLKPGRWLAIEQEIVVNTPGVRDGMVRVWVDGGLRLERATSLLADTPEILPEIAGVVLGAGPVGRAPDGRGKPQKVWITAPELRWGRAANAGL